MYKQKKETLTITNRANQANQVASESSNVTKATVQLESHTSKHCSSDSEGGSSSVRRLCSHCGPVLLRARGRPPTVRRVRVTGRVRPRVTWIQGARAGSSTPLLTTCFPADSPWNCSASSTQDRTLDSERSPEPLSPSPSRT